MTEEKEDGMSGEDPIGTPTNATPLALERLLQEKEAQLSLAGEFGTLALQHKQAAEERAQEAWEREMEAREEAKRARIEADDLRRQLESLEGTLIELGVSLEEAQRNVTVVHLQRDLENVRMENRSFVKRMQTLESMIQEMEQTNDDLVMRLKQRDTEILRLRSNLAKQEESYEESLSQKTQEAEKHHADVSAQLQCVDKRIRSLAKMGSSSAVLLKSEKDGDGSKVELRKLSRDVDYLVEAARKGKEREEELRNLRADLARLEAEVVEKAQLSKQLRAAADEQYILRREEEEKQQHLSAALARIAELEAILRDRDEEGIAARLAYNTLLQDKQDVEDMLARQCDKGDPCPNPQGENMQDAQVFHLERQLEMARRERRVLEKKIPQLHEDLARAKTRCEAVQLELRIVKGRMEVEVAKRRRAEADVRVLRLEREELATDRDEALMVSASKQRVCEILNNELEALRQECKDQRQQQRSPWSFRKGNRTQPVVGTPTPSTTPLRSLWRSMRPNKTESKP